MATVNDNSGRQLFKLVENSDWDAVMERVQNNPKEMDMVDENGNTVFHYIACDFLVVAPQPPLPVMRFLIRVDKENHAQDPDARSIIKRDGNGVTPFMLACRAVVEVTVVRELVRELVESAPECVFMFDKYGDSVGMSAIHSYSHGLDVSLEVFKILFHHDPMHHHVISHSSGETLVSALLEEDRHSADILMHFPEYIRSYPELGGHPDLVVYSEFRSLLHFCLYGLPEEPSATTPLLHRFLQSREFWLLDLERTLELRPELIYEKDQDGNLPLHVASFSLYPSRELERFEHLSPRRKISFMVEKDPSAASVRNNAGLLPLELAIQASGNTWDHGICTPLLDTYPAAMESFHLQESMYPRVLARAASGNPSTVFQMLKGKPTLAKLAF